MTKDAVIKIVDAVTKECKENFDKHKCEGYTLANKTTIPFETTILYSRNVSDWGTEEDKEIIICYSKDGWEEFHITVQYGAGVKKVIEQSTKKIEKEDVVKLFEELKPFQQMEFMHVSYKVLHMSNHARSLL